MMFRCLILFFAFSAFSVYAVDVTWDFSVLSRNQYPTVFRNGNRIKDGWLCGNFNEKNKRGVVLENVHDEFNPSGGFGIEALVRLRNEDLKPWSDSTLVIADTNYSFKSKNRNKKHTGFAFEIARDLRYQYVPVLHLGFGGKTIEVKGEPFPVKNNHVYLIRVEYDGIGKIRFWMNGEPNSCALTVHGGGSIAPSSSPLIFGDAGMHPYLTSAGDIKKIRFYSFQSSSVQMWQEGRAAFIRASEKQHIRVSLKNHGKREISGLSVKMREKTSSVFNLLPGEYKKVEVPVETHLRHGYYPEKIILEKNGKSIAGIDGYFYIAPIETEKFIVHSWEDDTTVPAESIADIGFNHLEFSMSEPLSQIYAMNPGNYLNKLERSMIRLDRFLYQGMRVTDKVSLGMFKFLHRNYIYRDNENHPQKNQRPEDFATVRRITLDAVERMMKDYGSHPALSGCLLHSECTGKPFEIMMSGDKSGDKMIADNYEKEFGFKRPAIIDGRVAPRYYNMSSIRYDGIFSSDDPLYRYYQWFYTKGLKWNDFNSEISDVYRKYGNDHFWTYHDPVTRNPSLSDRGKKLDVVSSWTYAYPEPLLFAYELEDNRAVALGNPGQEYMNMLQFIWYRQAVAPGDAPEGEKQEWTKFVSAKGFVACPEDVICETTWMAFSRHIFAMPYYSLQTLFDRPFENPHHPYASGNRTTRPESKEMLEKVIRNVLLPLGPTLRNVPETKSEVVMLLSFSQIFSCWSINGKGWNNMAFYLLEWANLNPGIIYEEHILAGVLDRVKVLVLPYCETLPDNVVTKIKEFQKNNGIIISDSKLLPAITPNLLIPAVWHYGSNIALGKENMQKASLKLLKDLSASYIPPVSSDDPDIIVRPRKYNKSNYLFVINDKRTFGSYLGPWKRVMEKGLPASGTVSVNHESAQVFDLESGKEMAFQNRNGATFIKVDFKTAGGKCLLLLPEKIADLEVSLNKKSVFRGDVLELSARILGASGKTLEAHFPLVLDIVDPDGKKVDGSCFPCAKDGQYRQFIFTSLNDKTGRWMIRLKLTPSGVTKQCFFELR